MTHDLPAIFRFSVIITAHGKGIGKDIQSIIE